MDMRKHFGRFVGETAPKTLAKINDAMNGVLFVDEAYSLTASVTASGGVTNYGEEAIAVLLKGRIDEVNSVLFWLATRQR